MASTSYRRRARGAVAALLTFAAWHAGAAEPTPDPKDQCIASDGAIGCVSERSLIEITTRRKDTGALKELVQDKLASGQCRLFDYGERVLAVTTHDNERTQVRRRGDKTPYWIATSWSRPAVECEGTPTAAALHQKLGLPEAQKTATADEPDFADDRTPSFREDGAGDRRAFLADRAPPRDWRGSDRPFDEEAEYGDEDHERPPPPRSGPLRSSRYAHDCRYKPVMSDADVAACRNLRR